MLTPYLLTAFGGYDTAEGPEELTVGIGAAIVVHLVLLGAYLLVGRLERALAARPAFRWTVVAAALVLVATGRPALISELQGIFGLDLVPTPFPYRILMNLAGLAIANLLIYALLQAIARNAEARRRLLAVLARLRAQAERIEAERDRIAADFQRQVARPVLDAIGALVSRDLPPDQLASELRWIAQVVVRPVSHRAAEAGLDEAFDGFEPDTSTGGISSGESAARLRWVPLPPSRIRTAPPWLVTLFALILLLSPELNANGPLIGAALLLAGAAVSLVSLSLVGRIPLPSRPWPAIALIGAVHLAVGHLVVWVLIGPSASTALAPFYAAYGTVGYAIVAVVLAITTSSLREHAEHQRTVAAAVAETEQRVYRARQALAAEGASTGRLLHTGVQGDIIGTSLRLARSEDPAEELLDLLDRVERSLATGAEAPASADAIREGLTGAFAAWGSSLDVETRVDDEALDWLSDHPAAAALANDAVTEGLTNAIVHSSADRARVVIARIDGEVEVLVAHRGRLGARVTSGMGLSDLDARARSLRLQQEGEEIVLRVRV